MTLQVNSYCVNQYEPTGFLRANSKKRAQFCECTDLLLNIGRFSGKKRRFRMVYIEVKGQSGFSLSISAEDVGGKGVETDRML